MDTSKPEAKCSKEEKDAGRTNKAEKKELGRLLVKLAHFYRFGKGQAKQKEKGGGKRLNI